jgi:glycine/D-amino acid oxidase-like deaminating enzyme
MTGGAIAGMVIADEILGKENPFAKASAHNTPRAL